MSDDQGGSGQKLGLYERLERDIRTPRRRLLVDAFLPDPETVPSAIPRRPVEVTVQPEIQRGFVQQLREQDPTPPPQAEPTLKPEPAPGPAKPSGTSAKTLQEEVEEFMNRDGGALAPEFDPEGK